MKQTIINENFEYIKDYAQDCKIYVVYGEYVMFEEKETGLEVHPAYQAIFNKALKINNPALFDDLNGLDERIKTKQSEDK